MKLITFIFFCLFSVYAFGQTQQASSYNYVNVSGDNAYILDSLTYSNNSISITRTSTQDSASLRAVVAADTLVTKQMITTYTNSYNRYATRLATIQALKTADSLRQVYFNQRLTQQRAVIDSIVAN